jgi:hypothetical protein
VSHRYFRSSCHRHLVSRHCRLLSCQCRLLSCQCHLLKSLVNLPLAIMQATAYLNAKSCTIAEYLGIYEASSDNVIKLLSKDFEDVRRYPVPPPLACAYIREIVNGATRVVRRRIRCQNIILPPARLCVSSSWLDMVRLRQ